MRTFLSGCFMAMITTHLFIVCDERTARADNKELQNTVQIAISKTLLPGIPDAVVTSVMQPFAHFMQAQTGMTGGLASSDDPYRMAQNLAENKVQIGIFEGVEFAWIRQKYPQLQPLVLAVNQQRLLRAYIVVRADSQEDVFSDLKQKSLVIPSQTRQHCRLFLARLCGECGSADAQKFFARTMKLESVEEALDELVDGKVDTAVLDNVSMESYKRRKPARFARLKIINASEEFPASVVVYHRANFDPTALQRFRDGLINTHKGPLGRKLLTLWRLTAFEAVPGTYEESLSEIVKVYPPPSN